MKMTWRSVRIL